MTVRKEFVYVRQYVKYFYVPPPFNNRQTIKYIADTPSAIRNLQKLTREAFYDGFKMQLIISRKNII
jgi:hypothetical protein